MSHRTKCNFSTTDRGFLTKISGFKGDWFSNLEKCQSLDKFKYLNILCYFCLICRWTRLFYRLVSFPQQDGGTHLLIRKSWLKTGLPPTAVNLLAKTNGHQTRQTLTFFIITSEELCLDTTRHFIPCQRTWMDWKSFAVNMKSLSCCITQSTRLYWASQKHIELVWKKSVSTYM